MYLAHPIGFEPMTFASGGQRSIQLSYGCVLYELVSDPSLVGHSSRNVLLRRCVPFGVTLSHPESPEANGTHPAELRVRIEWRIIRGRLQDLQ